MSTLPCRLVCHVCLMRCDRFLAGKAATFVTASVRATRASLTTPSGRTVISLALANSRVVFANAALAQTVRRPPPSSATRALSAIRHTALARQYYARPPTASRIANCAAAGAVPFARASGLSYYHRHHRLPFACRTCPAIQPSVPVILYAVPGLQRRNAPCASAWTALSARTHHSHAPRCT